MTNDELLEALADLESAALHAAEVADRWPADAALASRLFETWAHTVAMVRSDIDPDVEEPAGSLMEYLRENVSHVE